MTIILDDKLEELIDRVLQLMDRAINLEKDFQAHIDEVDMAYQASARNLLHYLVIRQEDLRPLQKELSQFGLTSLGRSEASVLASLDALAHTLHQLAGRDYVSKYSPPVTFESGNQLLEQHAMDLLGSTSRTNAANHHLPRQTHVMVTMPSEAAVNYDLVRDLVDSGMNIMRINCAHDNPAAWAAMVMHLRQAEYELGYACKVMTDLAGPKMRTGRFACGAGVVKVKPQRSERGLVLENARVQFVSEQNADSFVPPEAGMQISSSFSLPDILLSNMLAGDVLSLTDTRRKHRELIVTCGHDGGFLAESDRTIYLEKGLTIELRRDGDLIAQGLLGQALYPPPAVLLKVGEQLVLIPGDRTGEVETRDAQGNVVAPAKVPCSIDRAFFDAKPGQQIWFDDGKIGGEILSVCQEEIRVVITAADPAGSKLRAEKGINLPDTDLQVSGLTAADIENLKIVTEYADIVALSFVREEKDVQQLVDLLEEMGKSEVGIVLKIETRQAFDRLARVLLNSLQSPPIGVMVARGDLAVEVGFERLAEVQEQILWLCEAAHVPVIWATQVLENLAKRGRRTRAEITDAAMSVRAECVMLNKGPYIVDAVKTLTNIIQRMEAHQHKKRQLLRGLSVSKI